MLIYIYFYWWAISFTFLLYVINNCFLLNFNLSTNLLSFINRIHLNEFYTNNFYFVWTSLWYIPLYIFILIILVSFKSYVMTFKQKSIFMITSFFLINSYLSYYNINLNYLNNTCLPINTNILLINSVNKVHPFLLYLSLLIFFNILFNFYTSNINLTQRNSFILINNIFLLKNRVLINIFTLFLGSWWALQEGSWGGWWNWDFSEVFGIFILLKLLAYIHFINYQKSYINNWFYLYTSIISILLFYISIQLNFSYVSHNFGFRFYKFINTSIFFNYLFLLLLFTFTLTNLHLKIYATNFTIKTKFCQSRLGDLLLISILYILYTSLFILINDFMWNNFSTNLFNFQFDFNNLVLLLTIFLCILLFKLKLNYVFLWLINLNLWINLIFVVLKRGSRLTLVMCLHYVFIFTFMYSLLYFNESISYLKLLNNNNTYEIYNIVLDFIFLINSSNILENSTTFDSKYFTLTLSQDNLTQNFYPIGYRDIFYLNVCDNIVLFITINFVISFYLLLYKTNQLIIFK